MEFVIKFDFKASNNEAEYEALVLGMRMAQDAGALHLLAYSDSQLIVKQVNGEYEAKEESMVQYLQQIEELKMKFKSFQLQQIPEKRMLKQILYPDRPVHWKTDARYLVNKCEKCQRHATLIHQPAEPLNIMLSLCPFSQWRMDIAGPFPLAPGDEGCRLVCRAAHKVKIHLVSHPQANGQVEVTNRILVQEPPLEAPQGKASSPWYMGQKQSSQRNWECLHTEILHFKEENNSQLLKEHLDLVDELRETTFVQTQRYKSAMINAHNKRVKTRHFQVGDLVLRRVDTLKPVGKLDPKWEGPYKIIRIIKNGAYKLEDEEGHTLSRPWNVHNLRRVYS
ncbi:UNVERIFIED_CONTAM: hypothetical protein Slati_0870500 [Sesamum latifolium]|uniref:RNase H type-1 domain-containing protein n=1 Tax=Sesamum latifolium TaxID=2727402 RepID=A0AAW2XN59_9LAMI